MTTTLTPAEIIGTTVSRSYGRYAALVTAAVDELKIGGDTARAQVLATLAHAEATILCEPDGPR